MVLWCLLCSSSFEEWAELVTQEKLQEYRTEAKAEATPETATAVVVTAVTITGAVEMVKGTAEEFWRVAMAERMGRRSRETPRNGGQ